MNFLKGSIKKYHEKKLEDAIREIVYHTTLKNQMEIELKTENDDDAKIKIKKQIDHRNKLIDIWENNVKKINKQLKKLEMT